MQFFASIVVEQADTLFALGIGQDQLYEKTLSPKKYAFAGRRIQIGCVCYAILSCRVLCSCNSRFVTSLGQAQRLLCDCVPN